MAEKIYVNGISIKTRNTQFGDVLKVSIKADDLCTFLSEHKNAEGWVTLEIMPRKEVDEKGRSHYAVLDTWKPDASKSAAKPANKPKPAVTKTSQPVQNDVGDDEIPF